MRAISRQQSRYATSPNGRPARPLHGLIHAVLPGALHIAISRHDISAHEAHYRENETAISMTKILGYDNREIASLYLVSTSIVVVISDIISVVLGAKVMDIVWRIMLQTFSGWFSFHMTPVGYVKMFAFVLIGYLIVTVFDFSRIKRIPMDMALKNVE